MTVERAADLNIGQFMRHVTGPDQHHVTKSHVTRGQLRSQTTELAEHAAVGVDGRETPACRVECRISTVDCRLCMKLLRRH